jgi:Domain of unknown function (DUF1929)
MTIVETETGPNVVSITGTSTGAKGTGVLGRSDSGVGVEAQSETYEAVHAQTRSPNTAAIAAYNLNVGGVPANGVVIPGWYLLFALTDENVPSKGKFIQVA